jgi:hypothetical protein
MPGSTGSPHGRFGGRWVKNNVENIVGSMQRGGIYFLECKTGD